jgi:acetylornithine deacetylase/succinyl-diaminopimelate desuccinylase-like protein
MRGRKKVTTFGAKPIFLMSLALAAMLLASSHAIAADLATASRTPSTSSTQIDWSKLNTEALAYYQSYLRFDTSNPPDNTADAIAFLKQILDKEGIESQVFVSKPGMANLVARLPGPPELKPLLLMSHADVVPAVAKDWSHPPFGAELADGFVWGRGAFDNKAHGIMALMTMLALKRSGTPLKRSVVMMVNCDEEAGGENGANWMAANHWDAFDPAFAFNEGGEGTPNWLGSRGVTFRVAVSEKRAMWMRLTVRGKAGHGSMPNANNPNLILIQALARLLSEPPPFHLSPVFDQSMRTLAPRMDSPASFELAHLSWPYMMEIAARGPLSLYTIQALMHDTIAPTMLIAGMKVNVIPSTAEAGVDCRLLPDTDADAFLKHFRETLGPKFEIDLIQRPDPSPTSPTSGEAWDAMKQVIADDFVDAIIAPNMTTGGTDSRFLRVKGIPAYGFVPVILPDSEAVRIHGVDERLSIDNLNRGIRATYDLTTKLCARAQ